MFRQSRFAFLPFVGLMSACGASDAPLRPSEGAASVGAPRLVSPAQGATIAAGASPLSLVVENATVTPAQPLTYTFEIATDQAFANRVFVQEGVAQGDAGRTSVSVSANLPAGANYVWRARAQTTSAAGPNADAFAFSTEAAVALGAPVTLEPAAGAVLREPQVEFRVAQGARTGALAAVSYRIELATDAAFTSLVAVLTVAEQPGETRVAFNTALEMGRTYYWRVKAFDGSTQSDWSPALSFRAPSVRWPTTGEDVVKFVEERYAAYLEPTRSLGERQANMAFLRDRMIEAGLCGGLDLGWNLKRGGPEISIDFLTYRVNGRVEGIDIGHDYDNHDKELALTWAHGEFPFYAAYQPSPSCQ